MIGAENPHTNASQRSGYRDYYTAELRALVEDMYREDLERLEYEF